ncbi:MAG: ABC transporter permease [Actinomycetota bacterium]|jgi:ABC-2 type transport system permease protein
MRLLRTQIACELKVLARNGEQLLLILGIPLLLLSFFSNVDILPTAGQTSVNFLLPGIIALAIMSTAMVSLGIATGFERSYQVLKRLGATPLGVGRLVLAKAISVFVVEVAQLLLLVGLAKIFGANLNAVNIGKLVIALVLGTLAFSGIGLSLAGRLRGEVNLAAQNALYLLLLLIGGIVFPLQNLPTPLHWVARVAPSGALADVMRDAFSATSIHGVSSLVVLLCWAVSAQLAAVKLFRWN